MGAKCPAVPGDYATDVAMIWKNDPARSLSAIKGCERVLNDLLEAPPMEFGRRDLGELNLLCAPALLGSEKLDIPRCLARLADVTRFVKASIERNLYRFPGDSQFGHSKPMWLMAMLVAAIREDYGATYSPAAAADLEAGINTPFTDSREVFIHGLLDDDPERRWGTCSSMPVLMATVARRLGFPVTLAMAHKHCYCRWEDAHACFNIEVSNRAGFTSLPDEHYRSEFQGGLPPEERRSGYYARKLQSAEEFAAFLQYRVYCLLDTARYDETLLWAARALQFSPQQPVFPKQAYLALDLAMKHRVWRMHPEQRIPAPDQPFHFNVSHLVAPEERSLYCTITAHYRESLGLLDEARGWYEDACRHNFYGNNEQRDLQRFLVQHGMLRRSKPLLPPGNLGQPRRVVPKCKPEEEADALRRLADRFVKDSELVKAADALHDLYMFDPANAEVFQQARALERHPLFQQQFAAMVAQHRQAQHQANQSFRSPCSG